MSFLLDIMALIILGYFTIKAQRIIVFLQGNVWAKGRARDFVWKVGGVVIGAFWVVSSLLYVDVLPFFTIKGSDWMLNSGLPLGLVRSALTDTLAVPMFLSYTLWFQVGVWSGEFAFRRTPAILAAVVNASFPRGGAIPMGAEDVKAAEAASVLVRSLPKSYQEGFKILLLVIDSPLLVYGLTGKAMHFRELPQTDQVGFLATLQKDPILSNAGHLFKILASFGYYIQESVGKEIGYDESLIRRSYVR